VAQEKLIEALLRRSESRQLTPTEVLCRENEASREAFIVLDGQIETVIGDDLVVAVHGPGTLIGEVTAMVGGYRTATLRSVDSGSVAVIGAEALGEVFAEQADEALEAVNVARERSDRTRVAALLAEELEVADNRVVSAIAKIVTWKTLAPGEVLFEQGQLADAAYLVISGRLEAPRVNGVAPFEVGRGEIIGELGLLDGRPRNATVLAVRDTMLARLSAEDFATLSGNFSGLTMGLIRRVIDRADGTSRRAHPARSVAIAMTAAVDDRALCSQMTNELTLHGSTLHLSAAEVDRRLRQPGIAQTPTGGFGETRLAELIHHAEADFDHLLLEADPKDEQWVARSFRYADQIVFVCSPAPDADEERTLRGLRSQVPANVPVWLAVSHPDGTERPHGTAALRERFDADEVHHLRRNNADDLCHLARLAGGRGHALVLSGGGARGFAHLGVLKSLDEHGIPVDRVVGTSMGSVIAAVVAQRPDPSDRVSIIDSQVNNLMDYTLPLVSLLSGKRITASIERQFGAWDIEDLWLPFACIATNITTSESVHLRRGPCHFAVRASVAIPGVLPPVPSGNDLLVDGGVLDNLPVSLVEDDPSIGTIIASDVTPPTGPRAKSDYGLSVSGWSAIGAKLRRKPNLYPGLGGVLMRSTLIASTRDRDLSIERDVIDLYLDLDLRGVGLLDFSGVQQVADRGYETSGERIAAWKQSRAMNEAAS
jgi:predicted acylesterase/phospholipase RssA/CRP-like cAMP-binding protein